MYRHRLFITALLALNLAACSSGTPVSMPSAMQPSLTAQAASPASAFRLPKDSIGGVPLYLMDAPPSFDGLTPTAITLAIARIDTIGNGKAITLVSYNPPLMVNVLQYQQTAMYLGSAHLPPGRFDGLHVALARTGNTISFGSTTYPLPFGSTTQPSQSDVAAGAGSATDSDNGSASTIGINFHVAYSAQSAGISIDFNALESVALGNGGFNVRPVVYASTIESSGTVTGTVLNGRGGPVSNATVVATGSDGKIANTTTTDAAGNYTLHNVPAGTAYLTAFNKYKTGAGQPVNSSGASNDRKQVAGPAVLVPAGGTVVAPPIRD